MPTEQDLRAQLATLCTGLDRNARRHRAQESYTENCPLPPAVTAARVTRAYRMLMPLSEASWGSLVVDSALDRLEVAGIRDVEKATADAVWGAWQDNQMDSESLLAHDSALVSGRAFALVWIENGKVEISLDTAEQMVVQYRSGSRRHRLAALRRWEGDDKRPYATLYRPDGIYKFVGPKHTSGSAGTQWERLDVPDEPWPVPNPFNVVPVVELAVNRRLKPGMFGHARGEFEHATGVIDRINLLTFLGLVVAFSLGFPLRGVIGEKINREVLRDDEGNVILDSQGKATGRAKPPFDAYADSIFQLENPAAQIAEFKAADRKNLSVFAELDQLATLTKTPRHYFPLEQGMSNLSADAIRASEGSLHAKITKHKGSLGEGWEEVLRLCGLMLDKPVVLSPRAELLWKDHESRSLAERADAASKLKDIFPWQVVAEKVLNATTDEINRWGVMRTSDGFGQLLAAATSSATAPVLPPVVASANGHGAG